MKRHWLTILMFAGFAFAVAGLVTAWKAARLMPAPAGEIKTVTEFRDEKPLPAFSLRGPKGVFTNEALRGKWTFMFFGFTQCPDICPTALGLMSGIKAALSTGPAAAASSATPKGNSLGVSLPPTFQVVFVSVDPRRDTPELLAQYLGAFDPGFIGVSGDDVALAPLVKDLGVFYQRHDASDKQHYSVDHTAAIFLMDPGGRLAAVFSPPQDALRMAADYRRITALR